MFPPHHSHSSSHAKNSHLILAALLLFAGGPGAIHAAGETPPASGPAVSSTTQETVTLPQVVVTSRALDFAQEEIVPSLGATKYSKGPAQIDVQSQGANASLDQTMLRFPGVVQDELDKRLHVRGEEANLQYRINDVLLPDGLFGFGQELSTRFVDRLSLIDGSLPAQYGLRTAGVVDIRTKSGDSLQGGNFSLYGGSYDTLNPSLEYGGASGKLTWYFTGSELHNNIGLANPAPGPVPIHDVSDQLGGFAYLSYVIDDTSRVSLILSGAHHDFEIPNVTGQTPAYSYGTRTNFDSSKLDENQTEQSCYEVLTYQKNVDDVGFQISQFTRYGSILFRPDRTGDLMFNGVASRDEHLLLSNGFQADASWKVNDFHTLRGGIDFAVQHATVNTSNWVFPVDAAGAQTSTTPFNIIDNTGKTSVAGGVYLQDQWKVFQKLTINFGARFDVLDAYLTETQLSPRINAVYEMTDKTTVHLGYARYFTPPPLYFVSESSLQKFNGTSHAAESTESSPAKSERCHYFDVGIVQKVTPEFQAGLDGYYKIKTNVLDEGQFGSAWIFSPYNAARGQVCGVELTLNYSKDGFSAYGNVACSQAIAQGLTSGQFQFDPDELSYLKSHWYHLDHDQVWTASGGASYRWHDTKIYTDVIYGSGLFGGFANTQEAPSYATVNLGIVHEFKIRGREGFKVRFDIVNLFDKVYEIRSGDGIGVYAPQYIPRRGFYAGVSYEF